MIDIRQSGHALAEFLREYVNIRSVTVRDIDKYDEVHWFALLPQEPDCTSGAWTDGDIGEGHWLEVHKQTFERAPDPPSSITDWCNLEALKHASDSIPPLLTEILVVDETDTPEPGENPLMRPEPLEAHPEVIANYERFRPTWDAWSTEHRRRRQIQDAYSNLFRLYTQLDKQGETLELVLGLGLLHWPAGLANNPSTIRHPLVTIAAKVDFDPDQGLIRVRAADEVVAGRLELDPIDAPLRPEPAQVDAANASLSEIGVAAWDRDLVNSMLQSLANSIHPESKFDGSLRVIAPGPLGPSISTAPVLILRRRNQAGMARVYEQIADQMLEASDEIPEGWHALLEQLEDSPDEASTWERPRENTDTTGDEVDEEIYFPLPSNREQNNIVEGIRQHQGVLVQGPPGTGKSHTIANLICHLLASGKRVIVTAETGRALQVLRDKLPKALQPLCINLLGQTTDGLAELESSISGIQNRQQSYNPTNNTRLIKESRRSLHDARRDLARIDRELLDLRANEADGFDAGSARYAGTPSEIGRRVHDDSARHQWLDGSIFPADPSVHPPIDGKIVLEWWNLLRGETPERATIGTAAFPTSNQLPPTADFAEWVRVESKAKADADAEAKKASGPAFEALGRLEDSDFEIVRREIETFHRTVHEREVKTKGWDERALADALSGQMNAWERYSKETQRLLEILEAQSDLAGDHELDHANGHTLRKIQVDALIAAASLRSGQKWKTFGLFTPAELKPVAYLRADVTVDGRPITSAEDCDLASACAGVNLALEDLHELWSSIQPFESSSNWRLLQAEARDRRSRIDDLATLARTASALTDLLGSLRPTIQVPTWSIETLDELRDAIGAVEAGRSAKKATSFFLDLSEILEASEFSPTAHPSLGELRDAINQRDPGAYAKVRDELVAANDVRDAHQRRTDLQGRLKAALPGLFTLITASLQDDAWAPRLTDFEDAWSWRMAVNRLEGRVPRSRVVTLLAEREQVTGRIGNLIAEIAAAKAWGHFFQRLTAEQRQSLQAWREVTKKIGKGTGKSERVTRLRRQAREYMKQCRVAVPIWIMPRYLVAEMIDVAPKCFDVVIADEASQLGIESLFLLYLAEKQIIVGDDQQISPSGVGIRDDVITGLRQKLPESLPHRALLEPKSSLYQHAKVRLDKKVSLREHFRCMPEIIQFSNDLCYAPSGTPLDPLRNFPPDRLDPLMVRHVEDGYRKGNSANAENPVEAEAIVAQIQGCLADPRYEGLSMGVISLTGSTQAKRIEQILLKTVDPAELHRRRLICGDSYTFQGDERNIIFLSMVAAPGPVRITALTAETYVQRFNVAVSRAQDQLWLFHSVTTDDLNPNCLRHRLLSYMKSPARAMTDVGDSVFDSQFERDVYDRIAARGYRVLTQVPVGNPETNRYRIDLVVEGVNGRLAVECDGDRWHGPERYEADMARQRDLERSGWEFFRIRGGDFYRDPETAMTPLWTELERRGIRSPGDDAAAVDLPLAPAPLASSEVMVEDAKAEEQDVVEPMPEVRAEDTSSADHFAADVTASTADRDDGYELNDARRFVRIQHALRPFQQPQNPVESETVPEVKGPYRRYREFVGSAGPHPNETTPKSLARGLARIVETEGPVDGYRVGQIYLRGCGKKRMGHVLRKKIVKGIRAAILEGLLLGEDEWDEEDTLRLVLRTPQQPRIIPRSRGEREIAEIPPSEIRFVADEIRGRSPEMIPGSEDHFRSILAHYDLTRLTTPTEILLRQALGFDTT